MKKLNRSMILKAMALVPAMALPVSAMAVSDGEVTIRVMEMNETSSEQVMEHIDLPDMLDKKEHEGAEHSPEHADDDHTDNDDEHGNDTEEDDREHDIDEVDEHDGSDVNDRVNEHREEHDERGEDGPDGPDDIEDNDGPEHNAGPQDARPDA